MTVEELLIPRYKVIADYPNIQFKIGDIVKKYFFDISQKGAYTYLTNVKSPLQGSSLKREYIETMPHLFKKLEWWEERDENDMPNFIKNKEDGHIAKIEEQSKNTSSEVYIEGFDHRNKRSFYGWVSLFNSNPATEEQYKEYLRTN
jgi:hypothetical protein